MHPLSILAQAVSDVPGVPTPVEVNGYLDSALRVYREAPLLFWLVFIWSIWRFTPKAFQALAHFIGDMLGAVSEPALERAGSALDGGRAMRLETGLATVGVKVDELAEATGQQTVVLGEQTKMLGEQTKVLQSLSLHIEEQTSILKDQHTEVAN